MVLHVCIERVSFLCFSVVSDQIFPWVGLILLVVVYLFAAMGMQVSSTYVHRLYAHNYIQTLSVYIVVLYAHAFSNIMYIYKTNVVLQ